ncbi:thioredoxin domain-containing protein [Candidatus Saccharibacteria bacterium]|nr:thioredoxin domain-containing protein [Candidatus Saccharibacteria bacterium]
MKTKSGFSIAGIIAGITATIFVIVASILVINANNNATNYNNYDFNSVIEPDEHNGHIGDHIKGDKDAPVIIFEYADFQCPGCASINARVNKALEKSDDKLAIVYRNYLLSYHQNGTAAASAAEAAGLQGYWKEYADTLFKNQAEWEYATPSERTTLFNKYFTEITEGHGDLEKFNKDIASENVSKKISFDMGIGKRINLPGTPSFYIDDQRIDYGNEKGSSITINGKTITWDHTLSGEEFTNLLLDIVEAKTK